MQEIIKFSLYNYLIEHNYNSILIDQLQYYILSYIYNPFFPWVVLVLFLNRNNLKRPVIFIVICFWFMVSIGDLFGKSVEQIKNDSYRYWPFSLKNWYIGCACSYTFRLIGEIIGDWYPLLRTKAISNKKNISIVYVTCILFNLSKVYGISNYYFYAPKSLDKEITGNGIAVEDKYFYRKFYITWLHSLFVMLVTSILYDISIIYYLRTNLFNKIKKHQDENKNSFIEKFKQISEYRIIFSLIASFIFLPILLYFIITNIKNINGSNDNVRNKEIENMRDIVVNINYFFMYIDQILLRFYTNKNYQQQQHFLTASPFLNPHSPYTASPYMTSPFMTSPYMHSSTSHSPYMYSPYTKSPSYSYAHSMSGSQLSFQSQNSSHFQHSQFHLLSYSHASPI